MSDKVLLSLVLLIKDEARSIVKVIESAAPAVDRVDMLDTGSTDESIKLARETCVRLNLPLSIYEEPFVDYATSRNRSLELAAPHAIFGIQVSGDEYLHEPGELRKFCEEHRATSGHGEDVFHIDVHYDAQWTDSQRLVRLGTGWAWVGAVHEYMAKAGDHTEHKVPRVFLLHTGSDPERKRKRFYKDFELLRESHLKNPKDPRAIFYLAQTLDCLGMFASAAALYKQCAETSGWDEEIFVAKYRTAYFNERCQRPWYEVEAAYLDAYASRPWRAEPLIAIAEHYHGKQQYAIAYLFASRAAVIPYPSQDRLFIDHHAYAWKGVNLVGICAYYAGAYEEGAAATRKMLEMRPGSEQFRKNLAFYGEKLGTGGPVVTMRRVEVGAVPLMLHEDTFDVWIFDEIVTDDAYRLRTTELPPRSVVVDLGAHIGIFAVAVLSQRPAAQVLCYEMDTENFTRLQSHLATVAPRVKVIQKAVVGAEVPLGYAYVPANTGAHTVYYQPREGLRSIGATTTFREILEENTIDHVDLLKIDVEGSEYSILREAVRDGSIGKVDRLAGEWHESWGGKHEEIGEMLAPWFDVEFTRINDNSGMFFATRRLAGLVEEKVKS